jgi:hypothetical protein
MAHNVRKEQVKATIFGADAKAHGVTKIRHGTGWAKVGPLLCMKLCTVLALHEVQIVQRPGPVVYAMRWLVIVVLILSNGEWKHSDATGEVDEQGVCSRGPEILVCIPTAARVISIVYANNSS